MIATEVIIEGMTIVLVPAVPRLDLGVQKDTGLTDLQSYRPYERHLQSGHAGKTVVKLQKGPDIKLQHAEGRASIVGTPCDLCHHKRI
ncbi:bifunctional folylpolyglutamate synthase/dihydrofolate synthase [Sesbania bispinosa]|nr:bifunctional folylpolyglutamate synthase/dihydrofolate synthase [Sesbania bispinosa]